MRRASIPRVRSRWSKLASIFVDEGDVGRLGPLADELVRRFPTRDEGRYYQASALFLAGRAGDAERPKSALC
jgi:hypothetical protein